MEQKDQNYGGQGSMISRETRWNRLRRAEKTSSGEREGGEKKRRNAMSDQRGRKKKR